MDDWFALIGSSIPLRGAEAATLRRPFWFSQMFMAGIGTMIEKNGIALIPGNGKTRHAFIALDDVAAFIVNAIGLPRAMNAVVDIGGPQVLSWDEAAAVFGGVLGRKLRLMHSPSGLFRLQQMALQPFSPAAANLMAMNWVLATIDTAFDMRETAPAFGVTLTSAETFLREKSMLPAER
jgi:uncharacterized protein YbjT (DUF2867 family)